MLRNLILNGYISENYNDYISLFHEVSITKEDFSFERNVKGGYSSDFNYRLSNKIENLVERIDLRYFEREAILNFDLMDYLGKNYDRYSTKYDTIIRLLSNEKEKSINFIVEYIKQDDIQIEVFIEKLVGSWKGFWQYVYSKSNFTENIKNKYLELIIRLSRVETIVENQSYTLLKKAIEENANFLSLIKDTEALKYFDKILKILNELEIEFEKLDIPNGETDKLFKVIYENNFYKINKGNLLQMFLFFGKVSLEADFNRSNYSAILKSECQPMIDYINSNLTNYVDDVYLKLEDNKLEDESSLIKLLNNEDLNGASKNKLIRKVETKISDLKNINELEIKTQLLINNKVTPKWDNVTSYYSDCEDKIDQNLVEYLNFENVYLALSEEKMMHESQSFKYSSFRENLLLTNELTDDSYVNILKSSIYTRNKLSFENLNEYKVKYLIENILQTTKENYDLLREHFPNNHIRLIEQDFNKFIETLSDFETNDDDNLLILKSERISTDNKFVYIPNLEQNIITDNIEISKVVSNLILIKSVKIDFDYSTVNSLVKNASSFENKVRLVNLYINDIDNNNLVSLIKTIWEYDKLFEKGKPTYAKSEFNHTLLEKLKTKNLIKNYYDDKWNDANFRVTTNY